MAIRKRGSGWQVDVMIAGDRIKATFPTSNEAEAHEYAIRAAAKLGKPLPTVLTAARRAGTMAELLRDTAPRWKDNKAPEHSIMQARLFVDWVGPSAMVVENLTTTKVQEYVDHLLTKRSGGTINRRLAGISALAEEAVKQGIIPSKPAVKWRKETGARTRYYTDAELDAIFAAQWKWQSPFRAFFMFLVDTGCRRGEALKLGWSDIRGDSCTFRDTKTGDTRTIRLTPRCVGILRSARATQGNLPGPFRWVTPENVRTEWAKLRGVLSWLDAECVVHTFRHTTISKLIQGNCDFLHVQRMVGHKTDAVTKRYAHLSPKNFEAMRDILAGTNDGTNWDKPHPVGTNEK